MEKELLNEKKNLAAVLQGKRQLQLLPQPYPESISTGEVLLRISHVGLCGSDVHQWADGRIGEKEFMGPFILGHEGSATVLEVGKNVTSLSPGDKVALEPGISCSECDQCKTGRYNLCPRMKFFSTLRPPNDGILCRYKTHPAHLCHKLPTNMSLAAGALMEPLSVAVHACRRAGISAGDKVLICGAGPIGSLCGLVARAMGSSGLAMLDINSERLSQVEELFDGEAKVLNILGLSVDQIKGSLGFQPDIVMECTGVAISQTNAIKLAGRGSRIVLVGLASPQMTFPIHEVSSKELKIRGVFRYANCFPLAIDMVASGRVPIDPFLNSERFTLTESEKAIEKAMTGQVLKVMIDCGS